jgi:hypothetical protein
MKPLDTEYSQYFKSYIDLVETDRLIQELISSKDEFEIFGRTISEAQANFKYQPEKWSIKEVMQHIVDTERIFSYRALCIARKEKQALPGFDENEYVTHSNSSLKTKAQIMKEFTDTRHATISLFESFNDKDLLEIGIANKNSTSVRAIGFIIIGHQKHHVSVIQQKYFFNTPNC